MAGKSHLSGRAVNAGRFLALDRSSQQSPDKIAAHDDVDQWRWQGHDNGSGHDHIPLFYLAARKVWQSHPDRLLLRVLKDGHREERLIPNVGELPDDHHHKSGQR